MPYNPPPPFDKCASFEDHARLSDMISCIVDFVQASTNLATTLRDKQSSFTGTEKKIKEYQEVQVFNLEDFPWFLENLEQVFQSIPINSMALVEYPLFHFTPEQLDDMQPRSYRLVDNYEFGDVNVNDSEDTIPSFAFEQYSDSEQTINSFNLQENFEVFNTEINTECTKIIEKDQEVLLKIDDTKIETGVNANIIRELIEENILQIQSYRTQASSDGENEKVDVKKTVEKKEMHILNEKSVSDTIQNHHCEKPNIIILSEMPKPETSVCKVLKKNVQPIEKSTNKSYSEIHDKISKIQKQSSKKPIDKVSPGTFKKRPIKSPSESVAIQSDNLLEIISESKHNTPNKIPETSKKPQKNLLQKPEEKSTKFQRNSVGFKLETEVRRLSISKQEEIRFRKNTPIQKTREPSTTSRNAKIKKFVVKGPVDFVTKNIVNCLNLAKIKASNSKYFNDAPAPIRKSRSLPTDNNKVVINHPKPSAQPRVPVEIKSCLKKPLSSIQEENLRSVANLEKARSILKCPVMKQDSLKLSAAENLKKASHLLKVAEEKVLKPTSAVTKSGSSNRKLR
ncbi:unnamed protein product [Ceutorhynchus assimilis]|uniref:Uncharacterized protein n=1 Tax=Ceutorhynchus assimilis TaxID=467358 RepID=A0A9N9MUI6_9CUCU|nr:unnamed protein product [Ceutorhynchus assimilis]